MAKDIFTGNWKNRPSVFSTAGADATLCVFTFSVFYSHILYRNTHKTALAVCPQVRQRRCSKLKNICPEAAILFFCQLRLQVGKE